MTAAQIVRSYSYETLQGIVRQLTASGDWKPRLHLAKAELARRNQELAQ